MEVKRLVKSYRITIWYTPLMGRRKKLQKFDELGALPHVLQKPTDTTGRWHEYFKRAAPLVVELGCGYGEYTIALAQRYPDRNYIGIDIQGERLWRGATVSQALHLNNVYWLRIQIEQLDQYFAPGEIAAIWMTFPDPFPKDRHIKKRLTAPRFLKIYRTLLQPGGQIHLKTDAAALIDYTKAMLTEAGAHIDTALSHIASTETRYDLDIMTRYERKHHARGDTMYYLAWHYYSLSSPA